MQGKGAAMPYRRLVAAGGNFIDNAKEWSETSSPAASPIESTLDVCRHSKKSNNTLHRLRRFEDPSPPAQQAVWAALGLTGMVCTIAVFWQ
jgi:hypothetical protein